MKRISFIEKTNNKAHHWHVSFIKKCMRVADVPVVNLHLSVPLSATFLETKIEKYVKKLSNVGGGHEEERGIIVKKMIYC